jgi:hypothetical protein
MGGAAAEVARNGCAADHHEDAKRKSRQAG